MDAALVPHRRGLRARLPADIPTAGRACTGPADAFDLGARSRAGRAAARRGVHDAAGGQRGGDPRRDPRRARYRPGCLGCIGPIPAKALDITGGKGELVASADGGIALDAAPGQRVRVLAADVAGAPLVVVVLVPDRDRWSEVVRSLAAPAGVTPAS